VRANFHRKEGDPVAALADLEIAVSTFERLAVEEPKNNAHLRELGYAHSHVAIAWAGQGDGAIWAANLGEPGAGELAARLSLNAFERLAVADTADRRAAIELAAAHYDLALVLISRAPSEALAHIERARTELERLPVEARLGSWVSEELGVHGECVRGEALALLGDRAGALAAIDEAMQLTLMLAEANRESSIARLDKPACRYLIARAQRALGDDPRAGSLLEEAIAELLASIDRAPEQLVGYIGAIDALGLLAELRPAERCELTRRALALWLGWPGAWTGYTARRADELERALETCGPEN
jgi:tetratricopeptide (TPR) repeat protein